MKEKNTDLLFVYDGLVWVALHLAASWHNFIHGIDKGDGHSYGWAGYLLAVCYLLALLSVHFLMLYGQRRTTARVLGRYWAAALLISVFFAVVGAVSDYLLIAGLAVLVTPMLPLAPLLERIPAATPISSAALSLLCWLFCLWVYKKK